MNPGTQLGPYRVESLIGAGGMGEVYLGVDTRLDRQVAIKVLQGSLAKDAALRERFEREARTISSLSHPNICTLFDLGRHEDSDYLVMEYLQGETLADRIAKGPLPPREVVRIGLGIASALEAAHRQGIVHRDLKPGNVMLTKSGVKLLDFGLAKLSAASSSPTETTMAAGATEQKPLTEQGAILGTFQYMAPEQLEGHPADARTDIFALGTILYEMATGRRAFQGSTKASLIAAIIDREPPPMAELQPLTPPALERVVRACLAKDPDERIQTAHDVGLQLRWISEASSSAIEPVSVRRRKHLAPWLTAAVLALAAITLGTMWWRERVKPPPPFSLSVVAPRGYEIGGVSLSPDGRRLALTYVHRETGDSSIWLREVSDGSERQLVPKGIAPFWSPDGRWVGFVIQNDRILRVRVEGGQPETVLRTTTQGPMAWGEDGTILFCPGWGTGLFRVPASGGEAKPVTRLDPARSESVHVVPRFLPGGQRFLFVVHTTSEKRNEIWAGSLAGAKPVRVTEADALIGYARPYLLTVRDGAAYAQRFDAKSLELSGEPQRVVDNVAFFESDAQAAVTLSDNGILGYGSHESLRSSLNVYERNGTLVTSLWQDENIGAPSLSADEKTLLVSKFDPTKGARDLHAIDLTRKIATRLTRGLANYSSPAISPDGQSVTFHSDRLGIYDMYVMSIDGSSDRLLWKDKRDKFTGRWSPDGRLILATRFDAETAADIWAVPSDGGKPMPILATEQREGDPVFSPDGKWMAFLIQAESEELYVRPFPNGRAHRVSTDGGGTAAWARDGREVLWVSQGRLTSATLDLSGPVPEIGAPRELFRLPRILSAPILLKDGRVALLVPAADQGTARPVHLTTAWRAKMERAQK
jgi:serine/threonine protein kinase/Tol biopolymer transport system component